MRLIVGKQIFKCVQYVLFENFPLAADSVGYTLISDSASCGRISVSLLLSHLFSQCDLCVYLPLSLSLSLEKPNFNSLEFLLTMKGG